MEASENELSVPVDYVPGARGHGVLAVGPDSGGGDALAVWRLSPTGRAGGAWVVRFDEIERDPEQLRRIMSMLQDRCLVDWDRDIPIGVLARIAEVVPADQLTALQGNILTIPELLAEISEHRSTYTAAVEQHRASTRSKLAPLAWPTEMPDQQDLAAWAARADCTAASPVAATALALTAAIASTAQLWQATEQARYRRVYLRSLGDPQPLPPRWLARLREAVASTSLVSA
ncbi:DUF6218 family protein [Micromonospora inositola]|uniref:Uncharacterized protein n=1 Tax=Micromonospora inositola TaxID=47865 RepID=A0A1C5K4W9_9ACTN|nr:DUF6218 family protein [Micromonospora inositola]SCG77579.1 hypothetical protein GA0070613_6307 [Micromonospora inositola]